MSDLDVEAPRDHAAHTPQDYRTLRKAMLEFRRPFLENPARLCASLYFAQQLLCVDDAYPYLPHCAFISHAASVRQRSAHLSHPHEEQDV